MKLTPERKLEIELEESYRHAVRERLKTPVQGKKPESKIWKILNSHFVLFLLSSVVLAGITKGTTSFLSSLESDRQRIQKSRMLYAEASYRIARLDVLVQAQLKQYEELSKVDADDVIRKVKPDDLTSIYEELARVDREPMFSDFESWNLRTLLWKLLSIEKTSEIDQLSRAFQASVQLLSHFESKWAALMWQDEGIGWMVKDPLTKLATVQTNLKELNDVILPPLRWITQQKSPFDPNKALKRDG